MRDYILPEYLLVILLYTQPPGIAVSKQALRLSVARICNFLKKRNGSPVIFGIKKRFGLFHQGICGSRSIFCKS